jgi:hypothetical protein
MKQLWSIEELVEHWSLGVEDQELLAGKHASGRLGFAAQLAFYRLHAWFPDQLGDFAPAVIAHLADQIAIPEAALDGYDWRGRTERRHRQDIIEALGVWPFDAKAEAAFRIWLLEDVIPAAPTSAALEGRISEWMVVAKVERPAAYRLNRLIQSVRQTHETRLFQEIMVRLDPPMRQRLDTMLAEQDDREPVFQDLRADPGRVGWRACLRKSRSSKQSATLACQPTFWDRSTRIWSSGSAGGPRPRPLGSFGGIRRTSACPC